MVELVDQHGRPLRREVLTQEVAGPTLAGLRSPIAGYPSDGLNPIRLANILRGADQGDPQRFFELAELIEERDLHYVGVLGTRKRQVAQIEVTVSPASDDAGDVDMASMIREWLDRDELEDEKFDMLDGVGKGDSFTEIIWDSSEGQWRPDRLEWRDPRWFEYDRRDGRTPLLRGGEGGLGQSTPLEPFKFIRHTVKAKSGLPVRSGLSRIAAWGWMFKAFTQRDWAIFSQTYGQPVRLGKFASSASQADKDTLFRAVANIAGDMAAIIPEGMAIEFVESKNVQAGSELYERRADWLDKQVSKAVLGQTGTTDSKHGGIGDGGNKEHGEVRQDIKKADAKSLAATLNRDLVRPWIILEHGPQARYPKIKIEQPEAEDLKLLADSMQILVPLGMRVSATEVRGKFGLSDPKPDDELLAPAPPGAIPGAKPAVAVPALQSAVVGASASAPADQIADRMVEETAGGIQGWLTKLGDMMIAASSLAELRTMIANAYPDLDTSAVAATLAGGFAAAQAAGMSDVEDTSG